MLFQRTLSDRLSIFGEIRDWIPLSDSVFNNRDFDGNVLRWGIGTGYDLWQKCTPCGRRRLTAVAELVGWSVLGGQKLDGNRSIATGNAFVVDADGDQIVNIKVGLRYTADSGNSVSLGYGTAVTNDDQWYEDILRFEYRMVF